MSPTVSSEFERIWDCGRSARATSFGARGSLTSTAVKFFGALSWASHRMRRPSLAIWIDMPSPMPPNPSSSWCASCRKFQIAVSVISISPDAFCQPVGIETPDAIDRQVALLTQQLEQCATIAHPLRESFHYCMRAEGSADIRNTAGRQGCNRRRASSDKRALPHCDRADDRKRH